MKKSQRWWGMILRVLTKTGATVWARGMMYKTVTHSVLVYGNESLVVTGEMLKVLEGLHHWTDRWITGMTEKRVADR